ncbi:MAG: DUF4293 domain-containing protein [Bacteroidetes bacterium]|nr:DUF4293 domain-containing protein [Bacteroidota bacterium]
MIQRVQTIYLIIIKVFVLLFLFAPVGEVSSNSSFASFSIMKINTSDSFEFQIQDSWHRYTVIALAAMIMVLTLIIVFSYKNRRKQIKFNQMNLLLHILMISMTFFYVDFIKAQTGMVFNFGLAIAFPLVSIILILIANRAIRKDEKLVRSADRLR